MATKFEETDYDHLLECVHCGLCLPSCPTYAEEGKEADSPRGRIYLMKKVADGKLDFTKNVASHMDLCLGCTACETACPSGVHYGNLIDKTRAVIEQNFTRPLEDKLLRRAMAGLLPHPERLEIALLPARALKATGLDGLLESNLFESLAPAKLKSMLSLLPKDLPPVGARHNLGEIIPAVGEQKYRVALLTGCVMSVMFAHTNEATARVLAKNGCEVVIPRGMGCCGALHTHMGYHDEGCDLARKNVNALNPDDVDAIIINAAGCGAMVKKYGELLDDQPGISGAAKQFAAKAKDVSEFLDEIELNTEFGPVPARAAYHDACHLAHAQKVRLQPRKLLQKIPELELVPLNESDMCCGSAGPYNLVEPDMAERLQKRKVSNVEAAGVDLVINGNPGCSLQIQAGLKTAGLEHVEVLHTVEVLDRAYRAAES